MAKGQTTKKEKSLRVKNSILFFYSEVMSMSSLKVISRPVFVFGKRVVVSTPAKKSLGTVAAYNNKNKTFKQQFKCKKGNRSHENQTRTKKKIQK